MPEEEKPKASWEVDKKVPLALIVALLSQCVLGIWWASGMNSRINLLESQFVTMQQNYAALNLAREAGALQMTKTEDKVDEALRYLRNLANRSTALHPEFQDDPKLKTP